MKRASFHMTLGILFLSTSFLSSCVPSPITPTLVSPHIPESTNSPAIIISPRPTSTSVPTTAATPTISPTNTEETIVITRPSYPTKQSDDRLMPGEKIDIFQTKMFDARNGWGLGNVPNDPQEYIFVTTDGGQTWMDRTPPRPPLTGDQEKEPGWIATYFASASMGWATLTQPLLQETDPLPVVWRTRDSGKTWQPSSPLSVDKLWTNGGFWPGSMGVLENGFGWLLVYPDIGWREGPPSLFTTSDGGQTWNITDNGSDGQEHPEFVSPNHLITFDSQKDGWAMGSLIGWAARVPFAVTRNGGATWTQVPIPIPEGPYHDWMAQGKPQCGVSQIASLSLEIVRFILECQNLNDPRSVQLFLLSQSVIESNPNPLGLPLVTRPWDVDFINPQEGWLIGGNSIGKGSNLYHTVDGGLTWEKIGQLEWQLGYQAALNFPDSNHGWLQASNGDNTAFVRTIDGGKSWVVLQPVVVK